MELRTFISQAIESIIGGVEDAQKTVMTGEVVPLVKPTFEAVGHKVSQLQVVEFEVAIRADERSAKEAKLNVVAGIFGAGAKGGSEKNDGHSAILKFAVPVYLPLSPRVRSKKES